MEPNRGFIVNLIALFYYNRHYYYYLIYVLLIFLSYQHHLVTLNCDPIPIGVITIIQICVVSSKKSLIYYLKYRERH
jgi:hypothetical protein